MNDSSPQAGTCQEVSDIEFGLFWFNHERAPFRFRPLPHGRWRDSLPLCHLVTKAGAPHTKDHRLHATTLALELGSTPVGGVMFSFAQHFGGYFEYFGSRKPKWSQSERARISLPTQQARKYDADRRHTLQACRRIQ
jgi:hypothetical protein